MDREQAKSLGATIRQRRKDLGLSTTRLAELTDMNQASIVRFEQGQFLNPDPEKLRAIAEALDLNLADVLAMAGYPIPIDLPSVGPYLRTKYSDLPEEAIDQLRDEVARVLRKHGIEPNDGPRDGEDELPEDSRPGIQPTTEK
jgi:transcriptional regulator with XRE-family HTH domain